MAAAASKAGKAKSTLIPLGDRVVVEREESEQTTSGGILLPDSAKDKPAHRIPCIPTYPKRRRREVERL